MLISCADTSIVSTSLVRISEDFSHYVDAPWVVIAYLLTYMGKFQISAAHSCSNTEVPYADF